MGAIRALLGSSGWKVVGIGCSCLDLGGPGCDWLEVAGAGWNCLEFPRIVQGCLGLLGDCLEMLGVVWKMLGFARFRVSAVFFGAGILYGVLNKKHARVG